MQNQDIRAQWKLRKEHTAREHAIRVLALAANNDSSTEETLKYLKRAFTPIKNANKLAGRSNNPYFNLCHQLTTIRYQGSGIDSIDDTIRALATDCEQLLMIEMRSK